MAIKGKKRNKGGSSPRKPAAAPRPQIPIARTRKSFFKTRDGMFIIGIFVLVAIGVAIWLVGSAQEKKREKEAEQALVEQYTSQVQPALVDVGIVVSEMNELVGPPEVDDKTLKADAEDWAARLQEVQITFSTLLPTLTPEVQEFHNLFNEVTQLYATSANTFVRIQGVEDEDLRSQLFTTAQTQRDLASAMFESVIGAFDTYRGALDMGPSGLTAPAIGAPPAATEQPAEEPITIEPSPEG